MQATLNRAPQPPRYPPASNMSTNGEGTTVSYYVVIGDHEFGVKQGQYQAFIQGHIYAIYLESNFGFILSIEYIGPPED